MAKRILYFLLQLVAFGGLLIVGGNWDGVNLGLEIRAMQNHTTPHILIPTIKTQVSATRILIFEGLIFAGVLFVLILLFEALRKKLRPWASITTLAFVLAVVISLCYKVGLVPA